MMYFNCQNSLPRLVPCPAVFSITAITPVVCFKAMLMLSATNARLSSTDTFPRWLPGCEVEQPQPQLFATLHLVQESCATLFQCFLFRMSQVDEVTIVRQDKFRLIAIFFAMGFEASQCSLRSTAC